MRLLFLFAFLILLDFYTFKGIRLLTVNLNSTMQLIIHYGFWLITFTIIGCILLISINFSDFRTTGFYSKVFLLIGVIILFTVPKLVFITFHLADDIVHVIRLVIAKLYPASGSLNNAATISRAKFLTQVGIITAAIPFTSILYGMIKGKFNYKVRKFSLAFNNLPENFNGLKILQISDFHIGSFTGNRDEIEHIVELINEQECDLLFFTGDLVNNFADEVDEFKDILIKLEAKIGKYSILGNHDYGDYVPWNSKEERTVNLNKLINIQKEIGFNMLLNENHTLKINGAEISIIGVENWGLPPFPQHGDLNKAMNGSGEKPFKILLSHDPSHWDAEVLGKTDIDLTLSGHTHGMQFGVEIGNFKWSPVKLRYPRWADLYTEKKQHLYVNRGIGFIAFPGRVGIMPEITVFELFSKLQG